MPKETLHFKIGLSGTTPSKSPEFKILVNEQEYFHGKLNNPDKVTEFFEFDAEIEEGRCVLVIEFFNKESEDTRKNQAGEIVSDLLLNIDTIEIDEIDLANLKWTLSDYYPIYPKNYADDNPPELVKNCVNLGWNGRWTLPFQSPFYIWLLENI